MDVFEEEQLTKNFEHPDTHILVAYLVPSNDTIDTAKTLFCGLAIQFNMNVSSSSPFRMEAECSNPFSASIKMKIQMHPSKGCIAILRYHRRHFTYMALNSFVSSPLPIRCTAENWNQCDSWYNCKQHGEQGLVAFYNEFFRQFQLSVIRNQISFTPSDSLPICLSSTLLPLNVTVSGTLSFKEKQSFYVDIPSSAIESNRQWVIEISSNKKVSLSLRKDVEPTFFTSDLTLSGSNYGNRHRIICILDHLSSPKLTQGRYFIAIRGDAFFSKSTFNIFCKLQPFPSLELEEDNEEDWVIVQDESSPAGRRGKAQLIKDFPKSEIPEVLSSVSQPIPNYSNIVYSTSSSDSDANIGGRLSELYFSKIPNSFTGEKTLQPEPEYGGRTVPEHFLCPISREIMEKPVIAADGHSYELSCIEKWLETHIRSPMTGEEMPHKLLIANFNLKSQIEQWVAKPAVRDDLEF